jgi:hypothetical protein
MATEMQRCGLKNAKDPDVDGRLHAKKTGEVGVG